MPPRRRSRYVLLVAAVMVIMLYRVFQNSEWGPTNNAGFKPNVPVTHDPGHGDHAHKEAAKPAAPAEKPPPAIEDDPKPKPKTPLPPPKNAVHLPTLKTTLEEHGVFGLPTAPVTTKVRWQDDDTATVVVTTQTLAPPTTTPKPHIPAGGIHAQNPPGNLDAEVAPPILSSTTTSVQHWVKFPEHFPVADEDLIPLPTGKPKPIPKVQYDFPPESEIAKEKREKRLQQIKSEMTRAWQGYRKYAWMHDELSPVSARFRDPFCGWAATLVDALDTLWIMGMKEEFDEAAKAVKNIDFTYSSVRRDIPVFETIIRYLGGLTAAYDISGADKGDYPMLLEKAVELAEILMGVFDTPNRMPILYYNWAPEYVSQPHRAGTVGVAELGTMSMEFTRLAQLTGNQRYYDAIARITNALEDLQSRGTALNGIFPENLDASGCNRTATQLAIQAASEEAQRQAAALESTSSPEGYVPPTATVAGTHEHASKETPVHGAAIKEPELRRGNGSEPPVHEIHQTHAVHIARRAVRVNGNFSADRPTPKRSPFTATGQHSDWDCVEQGLTPSGYGFESYSMGGSQDSTYEYFSKEYLMLGGLEPKYKTMHIKTIEAVKKWLLYRPMVPGERDILFSAKASTNGHPEKDILRDYEVTHLTCFIGGMFGLGGKIFDRPDDVELAKKLADGCVWAYESTASGIMPEGSTVVPCQSMASCPWNETLWWEHLDPQAAWREKQILEWEQGELKRKEEAQLRAQQAEKEKLAAAEEAARKEEMAQKELAEQKAEMEIPRDKPRPQPPQRETGDYPREEPRNNSTYAADSAAHQHAKREPLPPPHVTDPRKETGEDEVVADLQSKLDLNGAGDTTVSPGSAYIGQTRMEDQMTQSGGVLSHVTIGDLPMSNKPQSHEEFVKNKIKDYKIPPGFVTISSRAYILRPEAIESVWYMYRITGDPTWQEKGWKMWEAIIKATRTEYGHSALDNTLDEKPLQVDGMESFWLAETLKYFYLLYSTPDVISLDDWVLNTEAHPFRRPK